MQDNEVHILFSYRFISLTNHLPDSSYILDPVKLLRFTGK